MSLPSGKQGGFSFSLGLKNTEKKGMIVRFSFSIDGTKEKKIFLTEVVDNEVIEAAAVIIVADGGRIEKEGAGDPVEEALVDRQSEEANRA